MMLICNRHCRKLSLYEAVTTGGRRSRSGYRGVLQVVIPTVLIIALLIRRWWVVPVAAIAWPTVLLIDGSCDLTCSPGAAGLAAANAAVAYGLRWAIRKGRESFA
jgi:hypothetical protein